MKNKRKLIRIIAVLILFLFSGFLFFSLGGKYINKKDFSLSLEGSLDRSTDYNLSIDGNGNIIYETKSSEKNSTKNTKISSAELKKLINKIYDVNYFEMADTYPWGLEYEGPITKINIQIEDKTKQIRHPVREEPNSYHPSFIKTPKELYELEDYINVLTSQ